MRTKKIIHKTLTWLIAIVWLVNGLFCKILHLVPRHELIVARILGAAHAGFLTKIIGISEVLMAAWIFIGILTRWNAVSQILIIAAMNIIEYLLAPDLLLFGKVNIVVAAAFIVLIYCNEFILITKSVKKV